VTKQRLIETFDIEEVDIHSITQSSTGFNVRWSDSHESYFSEDWLARSGLKTQSRVAERQGLTDIHLWNGRTFQAEERSSALPTVQYSEVMASDEGVGAWTALIRKYGFAYVDGCPPTPQATQKLLERIAFIRHTHYGGFWDFTSDLSYGDTAYTDLAIGAHTDTTYFTDSGGLQMFHMLSHDNGSGGKSLLVDGFAAAHELLTNHPDDYAVLATVPVHSHASGNEGISVQPQRTFPVLVHDPQDGHLVQVRWNTTDRAAIDTPMENMQRWYDAGRKWAAVLRKHEYWEQLQPGRPLIFDNWRVLHGRSSFTGKRRLCGGYSECFPFLSVLLRIFTPYVLFFSAPRSLFTPSLAAMANIAEG